MESVNHSLAELSTKIATVASNIKRIRPQVYEKVSQDEDTILWMNHPSNSNKKIKSGWLRKQGGMVKSWHRRWFVLNGECLFYFAREDDIKILGNLYLPGNKIIQHPANPDEPDKFLMEIVPESIAMTRSKSLSYKQSKAPQRMAPTQETFLLCASTDEERQEWVKVIRKVMFASIGGAVFGSKLEEVMDFERTRSGRKVPYVVESCINFLLQHGLEIEGIFRLPGRMLLVRDMKDRFDEGENVVLNTDEVDVHSVASLLKQYLRELPECLIPYRFYQTFMNIAMSFQDSKSHEDKQGLVQELQGLMVDLPQVNYNLLKHLCQFLSKVASHTDINKMTALNLATVFGPNIIRHPQMEDNPEIFMLTTADISQQLAFMLINYSDQIFTMSYDNSTSSVPVDDLLKLDCDDITTGDMLQPLNPTAPVPKQRASKIGGIGELSNIVFEQRGDRRARSFQSDINFLDEAFQLRTPEPPNLELQIQPHSPSSPKSADTSPVTKYQSSFTADGKPIPPLRRKYTRKKPLSNKTSLDSAASSEHSDSEKSLNSIDDTDSNRSESNLYSNSKAVNDTDTPNTLILELQQKLETMNADYESLQLRFDHLNASKTKSDDRVKSLSSQLSKIQSQYDDHIRTMEEKHKIKIEEMCQKLDEERSRLDKALKKVVELQTTVKDYELQYGNMQNKLPPLYQ